MITSFPFIVACLGLIILGFVLSEADVSFGAAILIMATCCAIAMKIVIRVRNLKN